MSWILIFISAYVPIVILPILILVNWVCDQTQPHAAHAALRIC